MPDAAALWALASDPTVQIMIAVSALAGLIRGFSGFGAALVFMPIGALFFAPPDLRVAFMVMNIFGPLPMLPRALREADLGEVARLGIGAVLGVPIGVWLLTRLDPTGFRLAVAILCLVALAALVSGGRYRRTPGLGIKVAVGWVSGILGGLAGIAGPPVVLFYLGGMRGAAEIRAALLVFFYLGTLMAAMLVTASGLVTWQNLALGLIMMGPHLLGGLAGARLFRMAGERDFRYVSYVIIGGAALLALPIF